MAEEKRLTLSDRQWGEFSVGDLFKITRGKRITKAFAEEHSGNIPVIAGGESNNGILCYLSEDCKNIRVWKNECITVASYGTAGCVHYQGQTSFIDDKALALELKYAGRNRNIYLFMTTVLESLRDKYNYGYGVTPDRYEAEIINLPTTPDGFPDYDFMENYIKQLYDDFADRISVYTKPVEENTNISLSDREWKEFQLEQLFKVTGSKTTAKNDLESIGGNKYPYITTQATNNSVAGFYDYATEKGNCIIAESAVAGFVSYQAKDFSASGHVEKLIPYYKEFNQYHGMFIVSVIRYVNDGKYNYGHKYNQQRIRETTISLPVTPDGQPDYEFMEQYIKTLPFSKAISIEPIEEFTDF